MYKSQDTILEGTNLVADLDATEVIDVSRLFLVSIQLEWDAVAGSGTGNIITEASNDSISTPESESTWISINSQAIAGNTSAVFHNEIDIPHQKIRVRVDWLTNTINSVSAKLSGKGI